MKRFSSKIIIAVFLLQLGSTAYSNTIHEQGVHAIEAGDIDQLISLLSSGLDVDGPIDEEGTPLQIAVIEEQVDIARYLIEQKANINAVNEHQQHSALHIATDLGNNVLVELLLSNNANPNVQDIRGQTPLFLTVAPNELLGFDTVVVDYSISRTLLIDYGADVNIHDLEGWSPLLFALVNENTEAVTVLTSNGARLDQLDAKTIADKGACAMCHNNAEQSGVAPYPATPHLASQRAAYIAKQLKDFRDGQRTAFPMSDLVSYLNDELIEKLSLFYEKLPRVKKNSEVSRSFTDAGKELYVKKCSQCHGIDGVATIDPLTPALAGQNPQYSTNRLNHFNESAQASESDELMRHNSKVLTKAQIVEVVDYIKSL